MKTLSLPISLTILLIFAGVAGAACPSMDVTDDCKVILEDFAALSLQWLTSYDIDDLTIMAFEWLDEGVPFDPIFINFQLAASPVPSGYLVDGGDTYGDHGKAYFLGYNGNSDYGDGDYFKGGSGDGKDIYFKISGYDD